MTRDVTNNRYIEILRYVYETPSFTESDICKALDLTTDELKYYVTGASQIAIKAPEQKAGEEKKLTMNYEALLNYLEYLELKEARASSTQAKLLSIIAITISAILAAISIGISIYQINMSSIVTINHKQADSMKESMSQLRKEIQNISISIENLEINNQDINSALKATNK